MKEIYKTFHSGRGVFFLMIFLCCIVTGAILKIASSVFLPFTVSVLLAFVMYPLVKLMDRYRIPRFISIFLVVVIIALGLYLFGMVIYTSGKNIVSVYPKYENRLTEIYTWIAQLFDLPYDESLSFWESLWGQLGIRNWVYNFAFSFINILISFISSSIIVIIFVVFILAEASFFREKLETTFEKHSKNINKMGKDIMSQITRYLTAKFWISLANGVIFAVAFHFIGLEFALVWGIIQFVLNFIPNLGSIAGGVIMSLFALIQFWPEPGPVIMVVIVILAVNMILGNILDPKIIGEHVGISPLMVLVSLAVWGWIWGFAGMILSVPMTVIIKIVCENIPIMEPVSTLLGTRKSILARKMEQEKAEI